MEETSFCGAVAVAVTLDALPDDALQQIIAACGDTAEVGVPLFEAVKSLACLSKALLQQLHRLRPPVGVQSLTVVQRPARGPWRVALLYKGELTAAVVEQARQGRVHSIDSPAGQSQLQASSADARTASLAPAVAECAVPALLGAGCSLLELELSFVQLSGTWASTFGDAAVCSAVLRSLSLEGCRLRGPLPELRLPALQLLSTCTTTS